jgi:hypothetical protein
MFSPVLCSRQSYVLASSMFSPVLCSRQLLLIMTILTLEKVALNIGTTRNCIAGSIVLCPPRVRGDVKNVRIISHKKEQVQTKKSAVVFIYERN